MVRCWIMGPMKHGYYLDPGRTAVYGTPTKEQCDLIESCARIIEGVMAAAKPDVKLHELGRIGDKLYHEANGGAVQDQAASQWPLYGHSNDMFFCGGMFGLKTARADEYLPENSVASAEAFLTWDGVGHHIGPIPRSRRAASHACIRGPSAVMPIVYGKVKVGSAVSVEE